jgi:hypothetical protein
MEEDKVGDVSTVDGETTNAYRHMDGNFLNRYLRIYIYIYAWRNNIILFLGKIDCHFVSYNHYS